MTTGIDSPVCPCLRWAIDLSRRAWWCVCILFSSAGPLANAQELRQIGMQDGAPRYSGVSSIALEPRRGIVFVADPVQNVVYAFDSTGALVQRIGRKGEGPGDFDTPVGLAVSPDGTLWVRDFTRVQLFTWQRVGDFEGYRVSSQFRGPPMPDWNTRESSFLDRSGQRYYYPHRSAAEPRHSYQIYTREGAADGRVAVPAFASQEPYAVWVETSASGGRKLYGLSAPPFSAQASWAITPDGTLLTTDGVEYSVTESDARGRHVRTYRRNLPRVRIPARLRDDSIGALRGRLDTISVPLSRVVGLPDSVRLLLLPEYFPSVIDVLASPTGARVVRRWTFGSGLERTELDFFSPAGPFLGTGTAAVAFARRPKPVIACGYMLGVVEDTESGDQVVVRARLDRCW